MSTVDMSQFFQVYFEESFEGLDVMESCLLNLDVGAADSETINTIFRAAHSIKGGSATFGFDDVAKFTHVMETLLDQMRSGERLVTQDSIDLLLLSVDILREMLKAVQNGGRADQAHVKEVQVKLEALLKGEPLQAVSNSAPKNTPKQVETPVLDDDEAGISTWQIKFTPYDQLLKTGNDPIRLFKELVRLGDFQIAVDDSHLPGLETLDPEVCYFSWIITLDGEISKHRIEETFEWVEGDCELEINQISFISLPPKQQAAPAETAAAVAAEQQSAPPVSADAAANTPAKKAPVDHDPRKTAAQTSQEHGSIRVSTEKIDALINMVGELVITQSMLGQLGETMDETKLEKLRDGLTQLERNTRELQESVMRIRMLPISFAFQRFPRMVRDLANKLGKSIDLKLSGEQTELDKTVMEKIGDPLVHLVRNSIDHGIERPDVRRAAGKPDAGVVHLNAFHQGGNIVIEITDDGAGLNIERILKKAQERGLVAEGDTLSDEKVAELIFEPGFSTADVVSDVSGRGVGMDVVKRNICELGGTVDVKSVPGAGSVFTIRLPLTLAILDGQLVSVGGHTYIIPLISIIESLQVQTDRVSAIAGQAELYKLREDYIPIVRLYELFDLKAHITDLRSGLLVVVESSGQRIGLFVDDLLGQQQVVIKSLETNFRRIDGVSGATILGDGTVALILDIGGLIKLSKTPDDAAKKRITEQRKSVSDASKTASVKPQAREKAA